MLLQNLKANKQEVLQFLNIILTKTDVPLAKEFYHKGGILFRGLDIDTVEKFEEICNSFKEHVLDYKDGTSPRTKLNKFVYTSTEYPKDLLISQHNELSYSKHRPQYLLFCCIQPSETGGETPLADCRKILAQLPKRLRDVFLLKGLKYIRNLHSGKMIGRSWQDTFETSNEEEIKKFCVKNDIKYKWLSDKRLRLTQIGPVTLKHYITQEEVWFNQVTNFHPSYLPKKLADYMQILYGDDLYNYPQHVVFGDDSDIPTEYLDIIENVVNQNTNSFTWKKGDILFIDNVLLSHGRRPFTGERKVLVSCFKS